MADHETKVTLTGEDKTGPMFKSVQSSISATAKEMEKQLGYGPKESAYWQKRAQDTKHYYDDFLKMQVEAKKRMEDAAAAAAKGGKAGEDAMAKQKTAAQLLTGELAKMVGGYLSVSTAVNTATKAFTAFAAQQRTVSELRNATGATGNMAREIVKNIEEIGVASGTSFDKANEAFTNLRETMNLTNEQALKLLPSVITQAAGANTSLSTFSKAFGDYMRNMNVPLEDANKIMEQFSFASGNMGVNLEKAGPHMAKMAEAARRWGYEGTKGSAVIMSMLAESSKMSEQWTPTAFRQTRVYSCSWGTTAVSGW